MNHRSSPTKVYRKILLSITVTLLVAGLCWRCSEGKPTDMENTQINAGPPDCPLSVMVAIPEMSVLYRGYDNQIYAVASSFDSTVVTANGITLQGAAAEGGIPYYIGRIHGKNDVVELDVSGYNTATDQTALMGTFIYKVSDLPEGQAFLGTAGSGDTYAKTTAAFSVKPVAGVAIQPVYTVKSWELQCGTGSFSGKGNRLSPDAQSGIQKSKKGSMISMLITYEATDKIEHVAPLILHR